jgi:hypothetical protein
MWRGRGGPQADLGPPRPPQQHHGRGMRTTTTCYPDRATRRPPPRCDDGVGFHHHELCVGLLHDAVTMLASTMMRSTSTSSTMVRQGPSRRTTEGSGAPIVPPQWRVSSQCRPGGGRTDGPPLCIGGGSGPPPLQQR